MCADKLKKTGNIKGSLTVEAALICPLLCLVLCGMIQFTMGLYTQIEEFCRQALDRTEQQLSPEELIRLEAVAAELFWEVK